MPIQKRPRLRQPTSPSQREVDEAKRFSDVIADTELVISESKILDMLPNFRWFENLKRSLPPYKRGGMILCKNGSMNFEQMVWVMEMGRKK
ncbi:hypothetical protein L1987_08708 [Smallanthus sonchifolius]|uniref:Uncharacterized protein n=1 Tax=Smallanthus sonchifolius TaxID=185202 RepID=A0ACB9JLX6_9ASTR|nr:hypothetical protein L1987_08708 [Smallanthus sonchifolius]